MPATTNNNTTNNEEEGRRFEEQGTLGAEETAASEEEDCSGCPECMDFMASRIAARMNSLQRDIGQSRLTGSGITVTAADLPLLRFIGYGYTVVGLQRGADGDENPSASARNDATAAPEEEGEQGENRH